MVKENFKISISSYKKKKKKVIRSNLPFRSFTVKKKKKHCFKNTGECSSEEMDH